MTLAPRALSPSPWVPKSHAMYHQHRSTEIPRRACRWRPGGPELRRLRPTGHMLATRCRRSGRTTEGVDVGAVDDGVPGALARGIAQGLVIEDEATCLDDPKRAGRRSGRLTRTRPTPGRRGLGMDRRLHASWCRRHVDICHGEGAITHERQRRWEAVFDPHELEIERCEHEEVMCQRHGHDARRGAQWVLAAVGSTVRRSRRSRG